MALQNTWFNRTFRPNTLRAEQNISQATEDVRASIAGLPDYQIPEQYQQIADIGTEAAGAIRGTQELAGEATDIARARTGRAELPGEAIARRDIQQSTAGTVQNLVQAGGGSAATLGAIAQAGLGEQSAFGQLAMQRAQYQSQAEQDLANAMRQQAGFTAQTEAQAAQLEQAGLAPLAQQEQQAFEYGRERDLSLIQYDIDRLGAMRQEEANRRARNAQVWGSVIGAVGSLGGAALGNPGSLTGLGSSLQGLVGGGGATAAAPPQSSLNLSGFGMPQMNTGSGYNLPAGAFGSGMPGQSGFNYLNM